MPLLACYKEVSVAVKKKLKRRHNWTRASERERETSMPSVTRVVDRVRTIGRKRQIEYLCVTVSLSNEKINRHMCKFRKTDGVSGKRAPFSGSARSVPSRDLFE